MYMHRELAGVYSEQGCCTAEKAKQGMLATRKKVNATRHDGGNT